MDSYLPLKRKACSMLESAVLPSSVLDTLKLLKEESGSHSPSINLIRQTTDLKINVDGCFLSNPYATDLFLSYFKKEILQDNILEDLMSYYPSQNRTLAKLVSTNLNIDPRKIFIANGAIEAIQAILHRFCGERLLVTLPTFSPYYEYAQKRMDVFFYTLKKENEFEFDVVEYIKLVFVHRVDALVLITPNNPTGNYLTQEQVTQILDNCQHLKCIIVDESFIHFAHENDDLTLISNQNLLDKYPNLVILKSLSKDFGLAGIRAGYALMNPDRVNHLLEDGYLWNSSQFVEYFLTLLSRKTFIEQYEHVRKQFIYEISCFHQQLKTVNGIKVYPTKANFVLIELLHHTAEEVVTELLIKHGIYLRDCKDKLGLHGEFIRVAARREHENVHIINSLQTTITEKTNATFA